MTRRIRYLTAAAAAAAAAVLAGFLAGTAIDRELVTYPAWKFLGPLAWAEFSRHADLGSGVLVYASGAIGCTLLTIAAIAALWRERRGGGATAIFLCAAAGLEIAALLLTLKAAPVMFGIRDTTEPADLARSTRSVSGTSGVAPRKWRLLSRWFWRSPRRATNTARNEAVHNDRRSNRND